MNDIKVGEYCRTRRGIIGVLIEEFTHSNGRIEYPLPQEWILQTSRGRYVVSEDCDEIQKHSENIIDLIEEFDYVNGYLVRRMPHFNNELCNFDLSTMEWTPLKNIDVWYNVVTHEQFDSIKYILGGKE